VKKGDLIMVFETSKTTYDVISEAEGFVEYDCVAGEDYDVNEVVARIFSSPEEVKVKLSANPEKVFPNTIITKAAVRDWNGEAIFSRQADFLINTRNIDRNLFAGRDFVGIREVEEYLDIKPGTPDRPSLPPTSKQVSSQVAAFDEKMVIVERLSGPKKKEIEYLSDVQSTGLTSTVNINVDTEGVFEKLNTGLKYFKNSLLPLVIYESSRLLRKFPLMNSYYADNKVAVYKEVNIGFAIDVDKGLKVVKLNKADESGITAIEEQMLDLSGKYLDDQLDINDLSDITFTITDLSGEGISFFRPLVNRMNSAILGMGSIDEKLQRAVFSLNFDHLVTEGKAASKFLAELKQRIESYKGDTGDYRRHLTRCYKCFRSLNEDLGEVGFVKCLTPKGHEAYICQSCLKGF
jgi:pyruvate/2-oxoglutarate dehydrogenase complex dihydrolipoamide acyltransferase (E2) component